jgi:hypothetical protein
MPKPKHTNKQKPYLRHVPKETTTFLMPSASETTPNLLFKKIIPYYLRSFHTNYIKVRNVDFFLKNQMKNYEEKY